MHWDDPEGWNGEGGGRRVQDGEPLGGTRRVGGLLGVAGRLSAAAAAAAAAAAKLLQSCPTLFDPIDGRPPSSPVPGILQARTLEWVAISFSNA